MTSDGEVGRGADVMRSKSILGGSGHFPPPRVTSTLEFCTGLSEDIEVATEPLPCTGANVDKKEDRSCWSSSRPGCRRYVRAKTRRCSYIRVLRS